MLRETQILSGRLVKIIEEHADELTRGTVKKLQSSPRTRSYSRLPHDELYYRVHEVYQNLDRWLWDKTDHVIQAWYNQLGKKRFDEEIPLGEVLWGLVLTKYHLLDYLRASAPADSAMELYRQQEFDRLIGQFFDRAVCYAAEGYEREAHLLGGNDSTATLEH